MKYRADIDGLRAVAVIPVVLFHAGFEGFSGGYLGVDIFFVISGYLITSIILSDCDGAGFSLSRFYERRARRILPALFLMMVSCLPFAWIWLTPRQMQVFAQSLFAVPVFSSNIYFWLRSGYFAEANELQPLLHTWSLSIEEQFYFLLPVVIIITRRFRKACLLPALVVLAIASLAFAQWASESHKDANFYLLPSRWWELAVGAILAVNNQSYGNVRSTRGIAVMPSIGLSLILMSVAIFDVTTLHPSVLTVAPVGGAALIIWFGGRSDFATRLLSSPLFVGTGLISYSLYLWHQPVFAFARIRSETLIKPPGYLALIGLSVVLAILSWKYVETPFRNRTLFTTKFLWAFSGAFTAVFVLLGIYGHLSGGASYRLPGRAQALFNITGGYHNVDGDDCWKTGCTVGAKDASPTIAIIGDSHAATLVYSFDIALRARKEAALVHTTGNIFLDHFPPFFADRKTWEKRSKEQRAILERADITRVILVGRYVLILKNTAFDNGEGGVESVSYKYSGRSPDEERELLQMFARSVTLLLQQGKEVVLVYPIPEVGWNVPELLARDAMVGRERLITTSYQRYLDRSNEVIKVFDGLGDHPRLLRVRPDRIFCDSFVPGRCACHHNGKVFYHDDDHLSIDGADLLVGEILRAADAKWPSRPAQRQMQPHR